MSKLFGSLCLTDIPKELIREAANGKKYLSIEVCERREPGKYGDTHYIKAWCKAEERKEGVSYFIGELKPSKYDHPTTAAQAPAQPSPQAQQPYAPAEQTITYVDDVPF